MASRCANATDTKSSLLRRLLRQPSHALLVLLRVRLQQLQVRAVSRWRCVCGDGGSAAGVSVGARHRATRPAPRSRTRAASGLAGLSLFGSHSSDCGRTGEGAARLRARLHVASPGRLASTRWARAIRSTESETDGAMADQRLYPPHPHTHTHTPPPPPTHHHYHQRHQHPART